MSIAGVTTARHPCAGVTAARHPRDAYRYGDCALAPTRCPSFRRPRIPSTGLLGNNVDRYAYALFGKSGVHAASYLRNRSPSGSYALIDGTDYLETGRPAAGQGYA